MRTQRERSRIWRQRNPEKIRAYRQSHLDEYRRYMRDYMKQYREKNKKKTTEEILQPPSTESIGPSDVPFPKL